MFVFKHLLTFFKVCYSIELKKVNSTQKLNHRNILYFALDTGESKRGQVKEYSWDKKRADADVDTTNFIIQAPMLKNFLRS